MQRVTLAGLLLAALFAMPSLASANDVDHADKLSSQLSEYRSFQAGFTQRVEDGRGAAPQETTGELKARRPGYFYWKTDAPMEQIIVADGERVTVYDPDLLQASVYAMEQQLSQTPALLLSGEVVDLAESFRISHDTFGDSGEEYTLVPREPGSLFEELTLVFVEDLLVEMRLVDAMEQRSVLEFENVSINEDIADDVFELDLPEDVDVIRGQEGL